LAFAYTIDGMTAGVGGSKKIYGTWTSGGTFVGGTITWGPSNQYQKAIGGDAIQTTAVTTAGSSADAQITANTMVVTCEAGGAGIWWVEVL